MANESNFRYYKPKEEFKFDITDMENFVYDMSRCIKCKGCTWVEHTYMPGAKFTLNNNDLKRQAHREKYSQIEQKVRAAIRDGSKVVDSPKAEKDTMGL